MTKRIHVLLMMLAAATALSSGVETKGEEQTFIRYLSGRQADDAVPWEFFCTQYRKSGSWTKIPVPSCWEQQGFGRYHYGHEETKSAKERPDEPSEQGQYRHKFTIPTDWSNRRVFIVFDGVMTDAQVKVNGASAGPVHQGAFYRFKHDITQLLKFGSENLLEVEVSKKSANESVNRAERYADYWVFGGIFRPVWLMAVPQQFVDRVAIDAKHDGSFNIDYFVNGEGKADSVEVTIVDAKGRNVSNPLAVPIAAGKVVAQVTDPAAWSAETPVLYTAVVRLKEGGAVRHEIRQRFGFRTIEVRKRDGIYVNGRKVILKGVCRHSFWPDTGRTLTEKNHRQDIGLIKEMNMNAVRMSHYPPDERFLELCDEEGLYVLDELAGWQKCYDAEVGRKLVAETVQRDVNHPSILFWDNGNEGGWNNKLNDEFAKYDPQNRAVLHPWEPFGGINTKHYPNYSDWLKLLDSGELIMPTELLHGLQDGGSGAGLYDFWEAFRKKPNGAGMFFWVFSDEGVCRTDENNKIDVKGTWAPDGIVGPHREKEGSFYTIKEIWSPVQIARELPVDFTGKLIVSNEYSFRNLAQCKFTWQLRRFTDKPGFTVLNEGKVNAPDVAPGAEGTLSLDLPSKFRSADALALTATDSDGREIRTWVWPLNPFQSAADALVSKMIPVKPVEKDGELLLSAAGTEARIAKSTGQLLGLTVQGRPFSLTSLQAPQARWTMMTNGWLKLEYAADPAQSATLPAGVVFDYPENQMRSKTWLGDGPYRVWRNRMLGGTLGVWETAYNTTSTGVKEWIYPEFSGYFAGVRWLKLATVEGVLTLVIPDEGAFVRIGTVDKQNDVRGFPSFPKGNLAVLRDIPAIGTKFHPADKMGPQGVVTPVTTDWHGTIFLKVQ